MASVSKEEKEMKKEFRSFEDARDFIHSLGIKNQRGWTEYCKSGSKPDDIPTSPQKVYKNKGWKGFGDWNGTGNTAPRYMEYRLFDDARKFVHSLKLKNNNEWRKFTKSGKLPKDISTVPERTYKNKGWKGFGDWLGTGVIATNLKEFRSFESGRNFVRKLKLQSKTEWETYRQSGNMPRDIPSNPNATYKNKGWKNFGDWLGTGIAATWQREYWAFEKAREYVHNLKLKSQKEWRKYTKSGTLPKEIPSEPQKVYKNKGWIGMGDWVGTGRLSEQERSKNFLSYSDARKIVHQLAKRHNIRTNKDWDDAVKKELIPDNIPKSPWYVYSKKRKRDGKKI